MNGWPLRTRLAIWCSLLLTLIIIVFGVTSAHFIYKDQIEAFDDIYRHPRTLEVVRKETLELRSDLFFAYAASLPLIFAISALGVWWVTRRALKPLQSLADAAESIDASSLGHRIDEQVPNDEVGRVIRVLNRLFDRLQSSFERIYRFTADAAHELKTPLTIMRTGIEDILQKGSKEDMVALDNLLGQAQRLNTIVENLLFLARADSGSLLRAFKEVNFSRLCEEILEDAEILAGPKNLRIKSTVHPGITLDGDEQLLRQFLLNMLDNAIKYNVQNGFIEIHLSEMGPDSVFVISNTGNPIPRELRSKIFERFYRVDPSRASDAPGAGLGLSLCKEILQVHKGQIWLDPNDSSVTRFVCKFPARRSEKIVQFKNP